jgi:hypothetical protein
MENSESGESVSQAYDADLPEANSATETGLRAN